MAETQIILTQAWLDEWNRIRNKVDNLSGDHVTNMPHGITIGHGSQHSPSAQDVPRLIAVKITGIVSSVKGRYTGKTYSGFTPAGTGDLLEAYIGAAATANDCEVWNICEITGAAPLATNSITYGLLFGSASNGKPIVVVIAGGLSVRVKVTGSQTGGGKYTGTIWNAPTSDVVLSTTLAESDIGAAGNTCIVLNSREVGKTTHDLGASSFLPLIFLGNVVHVQSDGTPVVVIDGMQWEDCA